MSTPHLRLRAPHGGHVRFRRVVNVTPNGDVITTIRSAVDTSSRISIYR